MKEKVDIVQSLTKYLQQKSATVNRFYLLREICSLSTKFQIKFNFGVEISLIFF